MPSWAMNIFTFRFDMKGILSVQTNPSFEFYIPEI